MLNLYSAFSQTTWSEIEAGQHTYPFALKVEIQVLSGFNTNDGLFLLIHIYKSELVSKRELSAFFRRPKGVLCALW
jgi:hypothetical protein